MNPSSIELFCGYTKVRLVICHDINGQMVVNGKRWTHWFSANGCIERDARGSRDLLSSVADNSIHSILREDVSGIGDHKECLAPIAVLDPYQFVLRIRRIKGPAG